MHQRYCSGHREGDFGVSPAGSQPSVPALLRELEALRSRLDQAQAWRRPQDGVKAGALAEEVKRLCQEASRSADAAEIAALVARARRNLDDLQRLLGVH